MGKEGAEILWIGRGKLGTGKDRGGCDERIKLQSAGTAGRTEKSGRLMSMGLVKGDNPAH